MPVATPDVARRRPAITTRPWRKWCREGVGCADRGGMTPRKAPAVITDNHLRTQQCHRASPAKVLRRSRRWPTRRRRLFPAVGASSPSIGHRPDQRVSSVIAPTRCHVLRPRRPLDGAFRSVEHRRTHRRRRADESAALLRKPEPGARLVLADRGIPCVHRPSGPRAARSNLASERRSPEVEPGKKIACRLRRDQIWRE